MNKDLLEIKIQPKKTVLINDPFEKLDLLVRLKAKPNTTIARTPLAVSIVIDKSGSMGGGKLEAAIESAIRFINEMNPADQLAVIAYSDDADIVIPLTSIASIKDHIESKLRQITANGQTNLYRGWLVGAQQLVSTADNLTACRVLLLSDGQVNMGKQGTVEICQEVAELAKIGISTSTVGFGLHFNEQLMTQMAVTGRGTAMYGEQVEDLIEPFESEISLLTSLTWRDVSLEIVSGETTNPWEMRNDYPANSDRSWRLPSIASGSEAWIAFSIAMSDAIIYQAVDGQFLIKLAVEARDADGVLHTFAGNYPVLPVVDRDRYTASGVDDSVIQRFIEIEAADIQRLAYQAVRRRDWVALDQMVENLENNALQNPWLTSSIKLLKSLIEKRDHDRLSKELSYSAHKMKNRLSEYDEKAYFSSAEELEKAAFLRRKLNQGKRL
jgi:Ca-activated chloride channel family protein